MKTTLTIIGLVLAWLLWGWFVFTADDIRDDLHDYARMIRRSELSVEDKVKLLDKTQGLEDYFHVEPPVSKATWRIFDSVARELLKGPMTTDKFILLEREIDRFEKKLRNRDDH